MIELKDTNFPSIFIGDNGEAVLLISHIRSSMNPTGHSYSGFVVGSKDLLAWDANGMPLSTNTVELKYFYTGLTNHDFVMPSMLTEAKDLYNCLIDGFSIVKTIDDDYFVVKPGDADGNGGFVCDLYDDFSLQDSWTYFKNFKIFSRFATSPDIIGFGVPFPQSAHLPFWVLPSSALKVKPYNGEYHIFDNDIRISAHGYETEFGAQYAIDEDKFVEIPGVYEVMS